MPAGLVEHEHDDALVPRPRLTRKEPQQRLEEGFGDTIAEIPDHLAACGLHEGGHIEPLIAVMAERNRALADGGPLPAQDGLQAEPVLIGGPNLDGEVRLARGFFGDHARQFFLKASRSASSAALG